VSPPRPTQKAAAVVPVVAVVQSELGCNQVPLTLLNEVPVTAYPDQFELTAVAARPGPRPRRARGRRKRLRAHASSRHRLGQDPDGCDRAGVEHGGCEHDE
jgi:hypothetical protein